MNKLSKEEKIDLYGWFVAGVVFWTGLVLFLVIVSELGGFEQVSWQNIWDWLRD